MNTVILVPYRSDHRRRDQLWAFVRDYYQKWHPHWRIFEGQSPPGPFNRSAAINDAAKQAGGWDMALIIDADTITPTTQTTAALHTAHQTGVLTAAFTRVVELDQYSTNWLLQTGETNGLPALHTVRIRHADMVTQSSALAIRRDLWDKIGGFDEQFVGWSAEDNAMWKACSILGGPPERVDGPAYHLYHRSSRPPRYDRQYQANQALWQRYVQAETEADLLELRHA